MIRWGGGGGGGGRILLTYFVICFWNPKPGHGRNCRCINRKLGVGEWGGGGVEEGGSRVGGGGGGVEEGGVEVWGGWGSGGKS